MSSVTSGVLANKSSDIISNGDLPSVLVVDDDEGILEALTVELEDDFCVLTASNSKDALAVARANKLYASIVDISLSKIESGLDLIPELRSIQPDAAVIMLTGKNEPLVIREALQRGAIDFIPKPFEKRDLELALARVGGHSPEVLPSEFIGRSRAAKRLREHAKKAAQSGANVLISGESGCGKEILARTIHQLSESTRRAFVAINCAAIPTELIESILFGHEAGAFTGAKSQRIGKFEQANGGDIFLDEISAMPLDLQAKLLRVLQEHEFERIGGTETIRSNFRVIAAGNRDLFEMVQDGTFREDLAYRLCVIQLNIPPLRERPEDIPLLINHYLTSVLKTAKKLAPETRGALAALPWPGNVRQLFNTLEQMIHLSEGSTIFPDCIPASASRPAPTHVGDLVEQLPLDRFEHSVNEFEQAWIKRALREADGNVSKAAKMLGIERMALYRRIERLKMGNIR